MFFLCPATASLGDLPSSITQEVSKMITECRGVILRKDQSVHSMFLPQACLCNKILLEMGCKDRWTCSYQHLVLTVQEALN